MGRILKTGGKNMKQEMMLPLNNFVETKGELKRKQEIVLEKMGNDDKERIDKIRNCGKYFRYRITYQGDIKRKLSHAYFCKDMFCPVCQKRKSMLLLNKLDEYVSYLKEQGYNFLHLVLTLRSEFEPGVMRERIWKSWRDLRRRKVMEWADGFYASLEVTFNRKKGWHFHLHICCATKLQLPMSREEFFKLGDRISEEWYKVTGDSYITKLIGTKNLKQFCKYITDYDSINEMSGEEFRELIKVMRGKKNMTKSGVFRGLDDEIEITESDIEEENEEFLFYEVMRWDKQARKYIVTWEDVKGKTLSYEDVRKILIEKGREKNVNLERNYCYGA